VVPFVDKLLDKFINSLALGGGFSVYVSYGHWSVSWTREAGMLADKSLDIDDLVWCVYIPFVGFNDASRAALLYGPYRIVVMCETPKPVFVCVYIYSMFITILILIVDIGTLSTLRYVPTRGHNESNAELGCI